MMGRLHVFKLSSNFQIDAAYQSGATISRHFLIMSLLVVPAGCTPITYQQLGRVLSEANHENNDAAALSAGTVEGLHYPPRLIPEYDRNSSSGKVATQFTITLGGDVD